MERMVKCWLLVVGVIALSLFARSCFGQGRSISDGKTSADIMRRQMESEARWSSSKKLSVFPVTPRTKPKASSPDPHLVEKDVTVDLSFWEFKVLSIVDDKNMLLQIGIDTTIWLEGFATEGIVDNQAVHLIGWMKCTGTKTYDTANGASRTVKSFCFISKEDVESNPDKYPMDTEETEPEYPRWVSRTGTTIEAKFLGYKGGVQLKTKAGKVIVVSLKDFSESDQEKLRLLIKERRGRK